VLNLFSLSAEAFDIILMTHPTSVSKLPAVCQPMPADFDPRTAADLPGRCLYRELVGISERDHRFDGYLNSQECLVNEAAAAFLQHYKLLLRADLGTDTIRIAGIGINRWSMWMRFLIDVDPLNPKPNS